MAHKYKLVGNLVFNQEDGEVLHAKTAETLAKFPVKFAIPIHLLAAEETIYIDTTGVKVEVGHFYLTSEMLKHLSEAYLEANAVAPSATDATVAVELYNDTDGEVITSVEFAGEGGHKVSSDVASTLKNLAGKIIMARINVTTASATSGATQTFRSIVLRLVYDFT